MARPLHSRVPSAAASPAPLHGRRLRVAVVGIGSAATRAHLPALQSAEARGAMQLVGVCDRDRVRRSSVLVEHPEVRDYDDNAAMLDALQPDLLVIATPPSAHLDEIAAAGSRRVHVLCEKPLGLRPADVAALRRLSADHPELAIATVHQYRHAPAWQWVARAAAGAIRDGEPFTLRITVERPGTDPLSADGWRAHPESEGGILGDHAVHYLSLVRTLDPTATVVACRRVGLGGRETASVDLRLGAQGSAHIDVSYAGGSRRNVVALSRPSQCLEMAWEGECLRLLHHGLESPEREVRSLADRSFVNALYEPMYKGVTAGLGDPRWRRDETQHTLGVAAMLATALVMAG